VKLKRKLKTTKGYLQYFKLDLETEEVDYEHGSTPVNNNANIIEMRAVESSLAEQSRTDWNKVKKTTGRVGYNGVRVMASVSW